MTGKYTTVLFDADDTLLDFKKSEKESLAQTLREYGMPVNEAVVLRYSEINASLWREFEKGIITKEDIRHERYSRLFREFEFDCPVSITQVNRRYLELLGESAYLIDGAVEICRLLKESGFDLYIITNGIANTQKNRMKRCGIDKFFTHVFASEAMGSQKPFKEFFNLVFNSVSEKDRSKILVVGDSLGSDIKGAVDSGLDCVWFNPKHAVNDSGFCINYEIAALGELIEIVNRDC